MKLFSPEEIDELRQHPAVLKVNEYFLHLTPEFKEWFYEIPKREASKNHSYGSGFQYRYYKNSYPQHPSPCFEVESRLKQHLPAFMSLQQPVRK